jgi:hypothetical protein
VEGCRSEAGGGVDPRSVLEVLGMLGDESFCEGGQSLAELGENLGANEVLYGLLGGSIGVDLDLELDTVDVLVGESSFPGIALESNARLGTGFLKGTYDVLIFLGVVCYLGDGD